MVINYKDFMKLDMRIGRIIEAEVFKEAKKPAYKLVIDFRNLGKKKSSAQITKRYKPKELVGRYVVAVVNFPPKRIADFSSEVLILGAVPADGDVILLRPDEDTKPGTRVL